MKVVIVAKTRMGGGACIGGITTEGVSVRLIASDAAFNDHFNLDYEVGELWEIESDRPLEIIPPHVENVIVRRKRRLEPIGDLAGLIERHMPALTGGPEALYEGLLQVRGTGALYIAVNDHLPSRGIPPYSTTFWRPDRPLQRDSSGKRIRYRYPTADGGRTLVFVGFQEPPETIPAGTLLRVSLAHWWRPEERPEVEARCYVQLSGWILPPGTSMEHEPSHPAVEVTVATMDDARDRLRHVFGYENFRPLQEAIIGDILSGRDVLAVMPTGSGKSLCFQLPALLFSGLTVVVSPLVSLMEDQVMQLRELGVPAAYLNHTLDYSSYVAIANGVAEGRFKLLYTAPETLLRPETLAMLDRCRVDCLTVDEAHCISEWGHDFRPEYRQLAGVRRRYPAAVCLAVTATATERVREDIHAQLGIPGRSRYISGFDRENFHLAVTPRLNGLEQTTAFLETHRGESGIIYCMTRDGVDKLTATLNGLGWNTLPYHAGLDAATRKENQRRFVYDQVPIIVATIAFGMGINKSSVRFILHYDLPKDLESYYQQMGRAGRDGLPADCLLLFSYRDVHTINFLIEQGDPSQRPGATARLQALLAYVETNDCRRRPLLSYFGESVEREACDRCDNCSAKEIEQSDLTIPAQKFLSCVRRTGEIFGAGHVIDILRGSRSSAVLSRGHDRLSTYKIGLEYSRKEWQQLARQFVQKGLLKQDMEHGGLKITGTGWAVLKGEPFYGVPPTIERVTARLIKPTDYDLDLFERLRLKRQEIGREAGVPPYVIFHDSALIEMATYYPQTADTLAKIQGVGRVKLERYGDVFLDVIRAYCVERGVTEKPKPATLMHSTLKTAAAGSRRDEILDLYNHGRSVAEIAEIFGVKESTVVNNLWESVQRGAIIDPEPLLASCTLMEPEIDRVMRVFKELGADRLRPVYDALEELVSYDQLHLLRLYFVSAALKD